MTGNDWLAAAGKLSEMLRLGGISPAALARAALLLCAGLPTVPIAARWLRIRSEPKLGRHYSTLLGRAFFYAASLLLIVAAMQQLGFRLAPFIGAAGVVGVAVGFASQTSLSNIISGLFIVAERPFEIGDSIDVDGAVGEVQAIDILSVKLKTYDGKLIRIPNETILKNKLTNITRFSRRRIDLKVPVAYKEDVAKVRAVLEELAAANDMCLKDPAPLFIFEGFGDSSVNIQFSVWAAKEDFLAVRNGMYEAIKTRFDKEGIELPFPHLSLYAGEATGAFPVKTVS